MTGVEPLEAPRSVSLMLVLSPAAAHGLDQDIQHTAAETRTRRSESVARRHGSGTELQAAGNHLPVSAVLLLCPLVNCTGEAGNLSCLQKPVSVRLFMMKPELGGDTPMSSCRGYSPHSCPWRSWHEAEATTSAASLCHRGQRLPGDDGYTDEYHVGGFRLRFSSSYGNLRLLRWWCND